MSRDVALLVDTLGFMAGGGHFWVFLNWALGLQANGCRVYWVEPVPAGLATAALHERVALLRTRLAPWRLDDAVALVDWHTPNTDPAAPRGGRAFAEVAERAGLALNFAYGTPAALLARLRRTALVDIDPGLTQLWIARGQMTVAPHQLYFTTGETVGADGPIPDCGLPWCYTPPCVALDAWPLQPPAAADAPFTTVSGWYADEWIDDGEQVYCNDKRSGFLPFLDLPRRTALPLELALNLDTDADADTEGPALRARGWRVRHAYDVAGTPADYQRYIQQSRGEFSAVKPSCVRLQNAWISDRTLCYLASGRPAVVRHTGPSRFLPDRGGLLRFRTLEEAASLLDEAAADPLRHGRLARALAEEHFDAVAVTRRVLERALP